MTPRYYVRRDRPDGTRTYHGPVDGPEAHATARQWRATFPGHDVATIYAPEAADDVARWVAATIHTCGYYYPDNID